MLRHPCGFHLANQAYDLRLIQDYFGHRNRMHIMRYTPVASRRRNCNAYSIRANASTIAALKSG